MNLTGPAQEFLFKLLEDGIGRSAEKLARLSHTSWDIQVVSVTSKSDYHFFPILEEGGQDFYGVRFTAADAVFLVTYPEESGKSISGAFVVEHGEHVRSIRGLNEKALAEIANILVNTVADVLADTCGTLLILSPPGMMHGEKEELFLQAFGKPDAREGLTVTIYVELSSAALSSNCALAIQLGAPMIEMVRKKLDSGPERL